jgi:hypothetical protein
VLIWPGLLCHVVLLPWCLGSGLRMRRKNPR